MENLTPLTRNEPNLDNFLELNIDNVNIKLYFNTASILFKITNNTIPKKDYESYLSLEQLIKINKFFANFETPKELVEWVINSLNKKNSNIQINEDKAILKILNPINNKTFDLILNLKKKDINARVTYLEEIIEQQNKKIELLEQRVKNLELLIKENVDEKKFFNESNILNKKEKKLLIEWLPKKPNKIFLLLNSIHDGDSTQVFKNKCSNKCKGKNKKPKKRKNIDNEVEDDYTIKNFCREDINYIFKEKVQAFGLIDINDIQIINISKDGNCFYRCTSIFIYFVLTFLLSSNSIYFI